MGRLECNMDMESRKQEYYRARGAAKRAIFKAKDAERKKFYEDLEGEERECFRLPELLVSKNRDVNNNNDNNNNNIQICTCQCSTIKQIKDYELQSIDSLSNKSVAESEARNVARDL